MYSIRNINTDYYMDYPIKDLDVCYSQFRHQEVRQVPVIRVWGTTPIGEKTCLHIHGFFPSVCIPYMEEEEPFDVISYKIALELDKYTNIHMGQGSASTNHVYDISKISQIPMYGYHEDYQDFLQISFYNPLVVKPAVDFLQGGLILGRPYQPYLAHINYITQFMIKYQVSGMSYINVSNVKYRYCPTVTKNVSPDLILPSSVEHKSIYDLETDALVSDIILNEPDSQRSILGNPGLETIWLEEKQRRVNSDLPLDISRQLTQNRMNCEPTETDQKFKAALDEKLNSIEPSDETISSSHQNDETLINGDKLLDLFIDLTEDDETNVWQSQHIETDLDPIESDDDNKSDDLIWENSCWNDLVLPHLDQTLNDANLVNLPDMEEIFETAASPETTPEQNPPTITIPNETNSDQNQTTTICTTTIPNVDGTCDRQPPVIIKPKINILSMIIDHSGGLKEKLFNNNELSALMTTTTSTSSKTNLFILPKSSSQQSTVELLANLAHFEEKLNNDIFILPKSSQLRSNIDHFEAKLLRNETNNNNQCEKYFPQSDSDSFENVLDDLDLLVHDVCLSDSSSEHSYKTLFNQLTETLPDDEPFKFPDFDPILNDVNLCEAATKKPSNNLVNDVDMVEYTTFLQRIKNLDGQVDSSSSSSSSIDSVSDDDFKSRKNAAKRQKLSTKKRGRPRKKPDTTTNATTSTNKLKETLKKITKPETNFLDLRIILQRCDDLVQKVDHSAPVVVVAEPKPVSIQENLNKIDAQTKIDNFSSSGDDIPEPTSPLPTKDYTPPRCLRPRDKIATPSRYSPLNYVVNATAKDLSNDTSRRGRKSPNKPKSPGQINGTDCKNGVPASNPGIGELADNPMIVFPEEKIEKTTPVSSPVSDKTSGGFILRAIPRKKLNFDISSSPIEENQTVHEEEIKICAYQKSNTTKTAYESDDEENFINEVYAQYPPLARNENDDNITIDEICTGYSNLNLDHNNKEVEEICAKKPAPTSEYQQRNRNDPEYTPPNKKLKQTSKYQLNNNTSPTHMDGTKIHNLTAAERYDLERDFAPQPSTSKQHLLEVQFTCRQTSAFSYEVRMTPLDLTQPQTQLPDDEPDNLEKLNERINEILDSTEMNETQKEFMINKLTDKLNRLLESDKYETTPPRNISPLDEIPFDSSEIVHTALVNILSPNAKETDPKNDSIFDNSAFVHETDVSATNFNQYSSFLTRTPEKIHQILAETKRNSLKTCITPLNPVPTCLDIEESLDTFQIPKIQYTTPYYSDYNDATGKVDVGHQVLKIRTNTTRDYDEFATSIKFAGIESWRHEYFQRNLPSQNFTKLNLGGVLTEHGEFCMMPGQPAPSRAEIKQSLTSLRKANKPTPVKREKTKIFLPNSPGNEDEFNNSLTLTPFTPESQKSTATSKVLSQNSTKSNELLLQCNQSVHNNSNITGVTLNNTHGFQLAFENLQDARAITEFQHITIMVIELHIRTRGELYPDPKYDQICAIFYTIFNDFPPESNHPRHITGVLCLNDTDHQLLNGTGLNCRVTYAKTEPDLIAQFVALIQQWDPDIFAGFEIEMLSWGYLIDRASEIEINLSSQLSRINPKLIKKPKETPKKTDLRLVGRIVLDIWRLLKHEIALQSYTFENLMYHVLHQRIPAHSYKNLTFFWDHRTNFYRHITANYYITRVEGVLKLLDHLDLINRTAELAKLFGIQFYDVLTRGSQFRVENMMLRLAGPLNFIPVSPSVEQRAKMRAPEWLPLILEPESRLYVDPIIVLDFQSLYPSIIIAYNYCFSTCIGRVEHLGTNDAFEFGATELKISRKTLRKLDNKINFSPCGVGFVNAEVRQGILPKMLQEILETRLMVKRAMKQHKHDRLLQRVLHNRQLGLKLIANVTYGYTAANFSGRMPCIEVGDSVVSKGRETLERAIKLIESTPKWDARVVYGDTDSLFVQVQGRSRAEAFKIGAEIAEAVTNSNPSPVKLKLEKVYHPCILQTKKRYVGYMYESPEQMEPEYNAKGIETVRRDGCPAVAKMLEKSLRILFETKDVSLVKRYVLRQFNKLQTGRASIQDLIFAREYRGAAGYRPGACVPAMELAKRWAVTDKRREPRQGERVPYIIVNGPPGLPLIRLVRCPRELLADPTRLRPNALYYITRVIAPALNRCFTLIGADCLAWYNEMPRKQFQTLPTEVHEENCKKSTISQYFATTSCAVCGQQTRKKLCSKCTAQPQYSMVVLHEKINQWERSYQHITEMCKSCCGRNEYYECTSLDCPVLYRMKQIQRDLKQVPYVRNLIRTLTGE